MNLFSDYRRCSDRPPSAVAIGNFDGVHCGHQALLAAVRSWSTGHRCMPTVLTFDPHPIRLFAPHVELSVITSLDERVALLSHYGIEQTLAQTFDRTFAALSPEAFARKVLVNALNAQRVVVGYDFRFGAGRAGQLSDLKKFGSEMGFDVVVIDAVQRGEGSVISSTAIRTALDTGAVEQAQLMLGRPYHVHGVVVQGEQRGTALGYPTANIATDVPPLVANGVYGGWLDFGEGAHAAVANVGHNPTFGADRTRTFEVHVLDADGLDLYGKTVRFWHHARIRPEQRFDDVSDLIDQIQRDCLQTKHVLRQAERPPELGR